MDLAFAPKSSKTTTSNTAMSCINRSKDPLSFPSHHTSNRSNVAALFLYPASQLPFQACFKKESRSCRLYSMSPYLKIAAYHYSCCCCYFLYRLTTNTTITTTSTTTFIVFVVFIIIDQKI